MFISLRYIFYTKLFSSVRTGAKQFPLNVYKIRLSCISRRVIHPCGRNFLQAMYAQGTGACLE